MFKHSSASFIITISMIDPMLKSSKQIRNNRCVVNDCEIFSLENIWLHLTTIKCQSTHTTHHPQYI